MENIIKKHIDKINKIAIENGCLLHNSNIKEYIDDMGCLYLSVGVTIKYHGGYIYKYISIYNDTDVCYELEKLFFFIIR